MRSAKIKRYKIIIVRVVALLVILNGLANIAFALLELSQAKFLQHFLIQYTTFLDLPHIEHLDIVVAFILGLVVFLVGIGLFRRKHRAWVWAVVILIILAINNFYPTLKLQTFILCLVSLVVLFWTHSSFSVKTGEGFTTNQIVAVLLVLFALGYGIIGTYLLRKQFNGIQTLVDSFYYTIVTYSTVGYGDITPVTAVARLYVASMILIGLGTFATSITVLVLPFMEKRLKGVFKVMKHVRQYDEHVILTGYNTISQSVANSLKNKHYVLFIESNPLIAKQISEAGYKVELGNPTEESCLTNANVLRALCLMCLDEVDATNILITMSAHMLRKSAKKTRLKIITRVNNPTQISKARHSGADEVFSPAILCEKFISNIMKQTE